jgi:hypothetical protein
VHPVRGRHHLHRTWAFSQSPLTQSAAHLVHPGRAPAHGHGACLLQSCGRNGCES